MCVQNMKVRIFQGLLVEFPVGVATRIWAFQHNMAMFLELKLAHVGEKAPKTLLATSTIDISKNIV